MYFIAKALYIFFQLIYVFIIVDIILSWATLIFKYHLRPSFIANILDPIYRWIKKILPTTFGPFDFTPIIVILLIALGQSILLTLFPGLIFYF